LIETFLFHRGIEFKPTRAMTQEKEGVASAEADESYEIEGFKLSIEVNFTSGDASKLERYQALGVHEVWIWEDGGLVEDGLNIPTIASKGWGSGYKV
jgi:Uma2 family endonuclease